MHPGRGVHGSKRWCAVVGYNRKQVAALRRPRESSTHKTSQPHPDGLRECIGRTGGLCLGRHACTVFTRAMWTSFEATSLAPSLPPRPAPTSLVQQTTFTKHPGTLRHGVMCRGAPFWEAEGRAIDKPERDGDSDRLQLM